MEQEDFQRRLLPLAKRGGQGIILDLDAMKDATDALELVNGTPFVLSNHTEVTEFDADSTTTAEIADVLCTLIERLRAKGIDL